MPANVPDTPGRIATLRGYAGGMGRFSARFPITVLLHD